MIPNLPSSVKHLYMGNNALRTISAEDYTWCRGCKMFDIQQNRLTCDSNFVLALQWFNQSTNNLMVDDNDCEINGRESEKVVSEFARRF